MHGFRCRPPLLGSSLGLALALAVVMVGCSPSTPTAPTVYNNPNVAGRVLALGNSLTAGFMNGGLIMPGQQAGYANLLSRQISGSDMALPLVDSPGISSTPGLGTLYVSPLGQLTQDPIPGYPGSVPSLLLAGSYPQPYDDLGVPGATATDVFTATSGANSQSPGNSFFDLILRNSPQFPGPDNTTQLDQLSALAKGAVPEPLLLALWIGSNDVLGGALSGNPVEGVNVTPAAGFQQLMDNIVARIGALHIPMVAVASIPSVTSAPYFTAVPPVIPGSGQPWNTDEANVALILLPAQQMLFTPTGQPNPDYMPGGASSLPASLTLTQSEVGVLEAAVVAFNGILGDFATQQGWAYVDVFAALASLPADPTNPATLATLNGAFPLLPGPSGLFQNALSAFSLDGIHPSERGYARVANLFLQAVNDTYGSSFPLVDESTVSNQLGWSQFSGTTGAVRNFMTASAVQAFRDLTAVMSPTR